MTSHNTPSATDAVSQTHRAIGEEATLTVDDIGGIDQCEISISSGVTLLTGENATNRTSLLRAINAVLGGDMVMLRSDSAAGMVQLSANQETYEVTLKRDHSEVQAEGTTVTDATDFVDRYVTLIRSNPIRQAVLNEQELRDLLVGPGEKRIEEQRQALENDRAQVQEELGTRKKELEQVEQKLGSLQSKKEELQDLQTDRDDLAEQLVELSNKVSHLDQRIENSESLSNEDLQSIVTELDTQRDEFDTLKKQRRKAVSRKEQKESQYNQLKSELSDIQAEISRLADDLETSCGGQGGADIETQISTLDNRRVEVQERINDLATVVEFNRKQLSEDPASFLHDDECENIANELNPRSKKVECWTCGNLVEHQEIEDRLSSLEELEDELWNELDEISQELEDLREHQEEITTKHDRYDTLLAEQQRVENQIETFSQEITEYNDEIKEIESTMESLRGEIQQLENELDSAGSSQDEDIITAHTEKSEIERERGQVEQQLSEVEHKIESLQEAIEKEEDYTNKRESLRSEMKQLEAKDDRLRTEISDCKEQLSELERETITQFNAHMDKLINKLEFDNIARIRLERYVTDTQNSSFELKIARQSTDGSIYEDSLRTLSESEREVTGLVVALAGYLVHDVHSDIPFVLLDALEPIDGERINQLIEYFAQYSSYLVAAVLPEDSQVLSENYSRISADLL